MGSQAWKNHERKVAAFFKTERRSRGDDFGRTDVEVQTSIEDWLGIPLKAGLIVECKYSKHLEYLDEFFKRAPKDTSFILRADSENDKYIMCFLDDFEKVFVDLLLPASPITIESITDEFSILRSPKAVPQYIENFHEQSRAYLTQPQYADSILLPIVCMAKAKKHGQVVSLAMSDIDLFQERLWHANKSNNPSTRSPLIQ